MKEEIFPFQGTGSTQQGVELPDFIYIALSQLLFSKNCMVEPHPVLLINEKNLDPVQKGHGSSWNTSLGSWKPYKMIRNSAFVYSASTIQG